MTIDSAPAPKPLTVTCTRCQDTAQLPQDRDHCGLWDAGWRWIGSHQVFSCPACPPVVVVTEQGRHRRGPGVMMVQTAG
ncbi:hypothetical protein ACIHFC_29590 [Streptomyces sp. NPDC052013]|uniref:hypothetical protein n=1 Tax=Streptomyces sp. NPDC052013 TaxID=3365679 RepID=UPI0037CF04DF